MKTTTILLTALLLVAASNTRAQTPERAVLFTLDQNEQIHYNEYFVMQTLRQNHFACIARDTLEETLTFIFNGERVATTDGYRFDVHYLNVHERDGYVIEYPASPDGVYINRRGTLHGPFHRVEFADDSNYNLFYYSKTDDDRVNYYVWNNGTEEGPFDGVEFRLHGAPVEGNVFFYRLINKWYARAPDGKTTLVPHVFGFSQDGYSHVSINGKIKRGKLLRVTESGKYTYAYKENGKWHVNINGQESREYNEVGESCLAENGKYMYEYTENGKWHVNINGEVSRGYDHVARLHLTESGKYMYMYYYEENGKWHVNINGNESRGYDNAYGLHLIESEKYMYEYYENGKWHVNINGQESKGYDYVGSLHLTKSGDYIYVYKENEQWYANTNGKIYNNVFYSWINEDGNYSFLFTRDDDGRLHENVNGTERETNLLLGMHQGVFDNENVYSDGLEIYSADRKHFLNSSPDYPCVVIDGKRHGTAPALYAWYDKERHTFSWNAIEGRELVCYTLPLK
jgi:uncharacterized protein (DUF2249 family)